MQYNIEERSATNTEIAKQKWEARLTRSYYSAETRVNSSGQLQSPQKLSGPRSQSEILRRLDFLV